MATYTMELRDIIKIGYDIFPFDYPIFSEDYRQKFEQNFINYFYFREIGVESIARFLHNLQIELNLIMPHYNKMYLSQNLEQRILDNYDVTETFERDSIEDRAGETDNTLKSLYSDTARKRVDIDDVDYVSNITKDTTSNTTKNNATNKENWTRKMTGNIGVQTDADAVMKYEASLKNIDMEVFKHLEILFMQIF